MSCRVDVLEDRLAVAIDGFADRAVCLSRGCSLPWDEVVDAEATTWAAFRPSLGWRVGGGYFPGLFATGWFTIRGERGRRQLLHVYRARDHLLVVRTTRRRPARVVVATPDAAALAGAIVARARGGPGGHADPARSHG